MDEMHLANIASERWHAFSFPALQLTELTACSGGLFVEQLRLEDFLFPELVGLRACV